MRRVKTINYEKYYDDAFIEKQQKLFDAYINNTGGYKEKVDFIFGFAQEYLKGSNALDVGCGVGTFAFALAEQGFNSTGVDMSQKSIQACSKNKARLKTKNVHFVRGNIQNDMFPHNHFDLIVGADIVEHLPENTLKRTLANCYRWLKPGGHLLLYTFPTRYQYQLITVLSCTLVPLLWIYDLNPEKYVRFLELTLYNIVCLCLFGKSYKRYVIESGHCNPPHPLFFKQYLLNTGFSICQYELLKKPLSPLRKNHRRFKVLEKIIEKNLILRPAIITVVQRPLNEKQTV